jgi:hypothetical protein
MSIAVQEWAWNQNIEPAKTKLLLLALARASDHRGACWPRLCDLAERCEQSSSEIEADLDRLEASGLIYRAPQGPRGAAQEIIVLMDAICVQYAALLGWRGEPANIGAAP